MGKSLPRREDYRFFLEIPTRWADQDSLGHVNNAVYYTYFDTLVATFLHDTGALDPRHGDVVAVVVETLCRHHAPAFFPGTLSAGLRVAHIGNSSVRYEIGLFRAGEETACAAGHFIHVHVDAATQRETRPVPPALREKLRPLLVSQGD